MKVFDKLAEQLEKNRNWQIESYQLGALTDEGKLDILKQELFRKASVGADCSELIDAINCIQECLQDDRKHENSFSFQISQASKLTLSLLTVLTISSVVFMPVCESSDSAFCKQTQVIPNALRGYFSKPVTPAKSNTEKVIDRVMQLFN